MLRFPFLKDRAASGAGVIPANPLARHGPSIIAPLDPDVFPLPGDLPPGVVTDRLIPPGKAWETLVQEKLLFGKDSGPTEQMLGVEEKDSGPSEQLLCARGLSEAPTVPRNSDQEVAAYTKDTELIQDTQDTQVHPERISSIVEEIEGDQDISEKYPVVSLKRAKLWQDSILNKKPILEERKKKLPRFYEPGTSLALKYAKQLRARAKKALNSDSIPSSRSKMITPGKYLAIEIHGYYGFLRGPKGIEPSPETYESESEETLLIVHSPNSLTRDLLHSIRPGDIIEVVYISSLTKGKIEVTFVTRSQYFSPGHPITSLLIGARGWRESHGQVLDAD